MRRVDTIPLQRNGIKGEGSGGNRMFPPKKFGVMILDIVMVYIVFRKFYTVCGVTTTKEVFFVVYDDGECLEFA